MNTANHDGTTRNATALVLSFIAAALLLWFSVRWLGAPGVRPLGSAVIAALAVAFGISLIVMAARRLRR